MTLPTTHPEPTWTPSNAPDPYIGLEALDDARVQAWVDSQNHRTETAFGNTPEARTLAARLEKAYTSQDRIVSCSRYGDWAYNTWQDDAHPLGIVRRTPWSSWLEGKPVWETILDVDALDLNTHDNADTRWALADFDMRYPDYDRALVSLSPGGSDACMVREFDIASKSFVADGFVLPDVGKHDISWIDRDTVYVGWDDSKTNPRPALTTSGFPREARRWKRGTPLADAPVVFDGNRRDVSAGVDYDPIEKLHLASRAVSFYDTLNYWLDETSNEWRQYDLPAHAEIEHWNGWLFVTPRKFWNAGGRRYAPGTLTVIRRDAFLDGSRHFTPLFTPSDRLVLAGIDFTKHWLIVSQMDDGTPRVTLLRPPATLEGEWQARGFALPEASQSWVDSIDSERDDTVLIHVEHFLTPPSLYHADLANDAPWQLLARLPAQFDATGLSAVRRHAVAPDGERIPYWLIGRDVDTRTDARPCLLYGYGGFEVALDPGYDATTGIAWLERGGLYAVANIRGGGEFGPAWHQAALRENRQISFDDFSAVAEALIDTGVTTAKQLAIRGGSNGGLLTGVCMVQRPELFGAVLSEVPLLDMARFHLLLQGASWIDEYGDPDDAADLHHLMAYSPYQNVKADVAYPPVLFTSSTSDDRVHPGHARKMAAKMQAQGHANVWYQETGDGGHGAGVEPEAIAQAEAAAFTFLASTIGPLA
ncbi:prolyl oligopeptidase family serine peptidase [Caballeronia sp. LZ029]|uniref:prolyl oligopeptidase family serine peptidase n=1 Tax=Caballeronia sp. LZ029 TaxID=3038564 RepID=UPI00285519BC|nr:prolyl oligopeptidase family serine peptidase [Caballeronia sp. LZ029]MDR5742304.1 prolyl oligopeptidase family serine peptidase [Caballeronia sp. LZ029]